MEEKYRLLSGVDIKQQRKVWDERAKGYYGEFLVFRELFLENNIPGTSKILMNIHLPTVNGKTTEIDLLMIHETGLYVFEIKFYKGTIYGKVEDPFWTQYFRTEPNRRFQNPFEQNRYHIDALKRICPNIPIYSFVVFTNAECNLRVTGTRENCYLCKFIELTYALKSTISKREPVLDTEQIDDVFIKLMRYAPIMQEEVVDGEDTVPFHRYIQCLTEKYNRAVKENEENLSRQKRENWYATVFAIGASIILAVGAVLGSFFLW